MKWNIAAGLLTVLVMEMHAPAPADACGVKLTVKSSGPRKAAARTSNPSDILLLGNAPRRLELDLTSAGHRVEVAPRPAAAKRTSYAVVITDPNLQAEARTSYPDALVIVRSNDVVADARSVEQGVARRPSAAGPRPTIVAARTARTVTAAGPERSARRVTAASEVPPPAPVEPVPVAPPPAPAITATTRPAPPERAPVAEPAARRPAIKPNTVHDEVYYSLGSAQLDGRAAAVARIVRWLTTHGDVQVTIEGHADPSGSPEGNLALAQKRAEWLRDQLVAGGIDAGRLEVISYGDTRLRYRRTDARNRRAAVVVK